MGNAPPSNGNTRDPSDPRNVMGTNGHHHPHHHGAAGPYSNTNGAHPGSAGGPPVPHHNVHHHHPGQQHKQQHQQQSSSSRRNQYGARGPGGGPYNTNINTMPKNNSDASMSYAEDQHVSSDMSNQRNLQQHHHQHQQSSQQQQQQQQQQETQQHLQLTLASLAAADDDTVPTVFRWEHGGRQVYITGTFNGWSRQIPMHRSGNDFTYIHNLKRGKHAFKFIVDDEWRFAPDQPTVADIDGRINNFIDVTDFKPYTGDKDFEREKAAAYYSQRRNAPVNSGNKSGGAGQVQHHQGQGPMQGQGQGGSDMGGNGTGVEGTSGAIVPDMFIDPDGEVFTHNMPDLDEYTKDPPPLPPHLRHIILNKPPQLSDTAALPVPQHVALNHLYCTAIKDNMMVLGITQRFRTKFVTTVYYSPELSRT